MKLLRYLLAALILVVALPAQAGIIGTYRHSSTGQGLIIEVADNGDFRSNFEGQPAYLLMVGGVGYVVYPDHAGLVSDYAAVIRERRAPVAPGTPPEFTIVQSGTSDLHGRTGRAYYPDFGSGPMRKRLVWLISDDPALKPLGLAFSRHYATGLEMGAPMMPVSPEAMRVFNAPMATGTPLIAFIKYELEGVEFRAIAPERFAVPRQLETREQLRARMAL